MIKKVFGSLETAPEPQALQDRVDSDLFVSYRRIVGRVQPDKNASSIGKTGSMVSSSLTCTSSKVGTKNEMKQKTEEEIRSEYITLIKSRQETAEIVLVFEGIGNL